MTVPEGRPIDPQRLPMIAAVDSNVLFRALEPNHVDKFAQACRDFWTAMLADKNREIIIPAPVFAEYTRKKITPLPSTRQVYVVPFDRKCAELLAESLGDSILKFEMADLRAEYGKNAPGSYIKYDAMVVACAKVHGAHRLVAIDKGVTKLAARIPIDCQLPTYFYSTAPQQLGLLPPAVTSGPAEPSEGRGEAEE